MTVYAECCTTPSAWLANQRKCVSAIQETCLINKVWWRVWRRQQLCNRMHSLPGPVLAVPVEHSMLLCNVACVEATAESLCGPFSS